LDNLVAVVVAVVKNVVLDLLSLNVDQVNQNSLVLYLFVLDMNEAVEHFVRSEQSQLRKIKFF
jgi:hypothetical protein